jgi:hypothetical protein
MNIHDIVTALGGVKTLYSALSGLLTLLLGKTKAAPFEDDMPVPMKAVLVCLSLAEILIIEPAKNTLGAELLAVYLAVALVLSLVIYLTLYYMFGYDKIIAAVKAGWFRTNIKYSQVKILGGLWKTPAAKSSSRNTQDFLADNAYDQDKVWPRVSRLPAQIAAVLSYIIIVVSLMGLLILLGLLALPAA